MYQEHSAFVTPPDAFTIWRYMSFTKFAWLIANESLYFSRLDQHDDEWEGLVSSMPQDIQHRKYVRFTKYINCWHISDDESDAMWKLYGPPRETVAIKTTVGGLKGSLSSGVPVYMGEVSYEEGNIPEGNLYWPVVFKRKPFRHERELRLCVSSPRNDNPSDFTRLREELTSIGIIRSEMELLKGIGPTGIPVRVNLNQLIREVVTCPTASLCLNESVEYVTKSRDLHVKIGTSNI
jgi:hypothetical protein